MMANSMSSPPNDTAKTPLAPQAPAAPCLLTVNGGSSSLKFALYDFESSLAGSPRRVLGGMIERIGLPDARMSVKRDGRTEADAWPISAPGLRAAVDLLIDWLMQAVDCEMIAGVGFRVVHGGPRFHLPEPVTPELIAELRRIIPLDVDHLPGQIALIERVHERLPNLPRVACFDTGFHHGMPRVATIVPIPRRFEAAGVRRYGFHGLSYAFLMEEIARLADPSVASGRVIMAHLGSGASLAAVRAGRSIDTTMGLTPSSGLVMSTRSGDIDPGLAWYLAESCGVAAEPFYRMVNHESGLLGVSETYRDMRDLLAQRDRDVRAAEAVALFCYQAKKGIGGLAAALGGLDLLVFSGGIGENSPEVRALICEGLEFLGVTLDTERNNASAALITTEQSRTPVQVIRTDEESIIAKASAAVLDQK
jgi:acetate kinase